MAAPHRALCVCLSLRYVLRTCSMKSPLRVLLECFGLRLYVRNLSWRFGRRIYMRARGEVPNHPSVNGEYALLRLVAGLQERGTKPTFLDVGANRGDWSAEVQRACAARGLSPSIHAFEPSSSTYVSLNNRFASFAGVHAHRLALGEFKGTAELCVDGPMGGTNSLSSRAIGEREPVQVETLDGFLEEHDIGRVAMVKTDTEGFDHAVMKGARNALDKKAIDLWQFEYNWRWLDCRHCLRDVFDLAAACGYEVGRVTRSGRIEIYESWNPELERYFEANFCIVHGEAPWCAVLCDRYRFNRSNVLEALARDK